MRWNVTRKRIWLIASVSTAVSISPSRGFSDLRSGISDWGQSADAPRTLAGQRYTGNESKTPIGFLTTALLGRDELVYVLDQQNNVIHVAKGSAQLRLLSRGGRGPGEMQRPNRMSFLGDSIVVPDASLARVTVFALKGRTFRTADLALARVAGFYGVDPVAFGASALVLEAWNVPGSMNGAEGGDDVVLLMRRHGASRLDTVARLRRGRLRMDIPALLRGQSTNMQREQPFVTTPMWDYAREGGGVVVLDTVGHAGTTINLRLRQWSNEGKLLRTCIVPQALQPLSNAAFEAGVQSLGPPPGARDIVKVDMSTVRRLVARPNWLPPFRSVRLSSDGTVWIRSAAGFVAKYEEYLVLAPTGCATPRAVQLPLDVVVEDARGRTFITSGYVDDAQAIDTWRY